MAERTAFEEVFRKTLSVARLEPYYRKTSSFEAMMEFYEWNLKLSAAFLTVFQTFEVVLRNAVAEALIKAYGYHWFMDKSFRITLRAPMRSMLEEALEDDMDRHGNNLEFPS